MKNNTGKKGAGKTVRNTTLDTVRLFFLIPFSLKEKIAIGCFFMSGFVSLLYEICWIRQSSLVFGSTLYAAGCVIAVFFGGLALGSFLSGRFFAATSKPLVLYAILELAIGFFALVTPYLFILLDNIYSVLYPWVAPDFPLLTLSRFFFISLILLPPTVFIGSTFPLFARHYIANDKQISFFISYLYALNTFGATLGCACSGFFLLKNWGITTTIHAGALVNLCIGITVLSLRMYRIPVQNRQQTGETTPSFSHNKPAEKQRAGIVAGLFFFSGFLALGYEILWARYVTLLVYNTIYIYILILTTTLFGISLGSIIALVILDRKFPSLPVFGIGQILMGLSILTVLLLPLPFWRSILNTDSISIQMGIIAFLFLIPSLLAGVAFPAAIKAVTHRYELAPAKIGLMISINTFGGILGSLGMAFFILPNAGLQNSIYGMTLAGILVGIIALLSIEKTFPFSLKIFFCVVPLMVWLLLPLVMKTALPRDFLAQKENLIAYKEGLNATLAVVRNKTDVVTLEIDRLWQGQAESTHQIMAAHIPMICHPDPRDILVVGLGVGQTAERFLYYPVTSLTCVDIEKELPPLIRRFFGGAFLDDKRVRMVVDDGRNYLKHTRKKFDIISVEIGQPFRQGLASFYTNDFYRQAKTALSPGGLFCQFMPLIFFDAQQYKSLIATFTSVFPRSILWYNYYECIMVGFTDTSCSIDRNRFNEVTAIPKVKEDLDYSYWGGSRYSLKSFDIFISSVLLGPPDLVRCGKNGRLFTDDKPVLEFETAQHQRYSAVSIKDILDTLRTYRGNPWSLVKNTFDCPISAQEVRTIQDLNLNNILALELFEKYSESNNDILSLRQAYNLNPKNLSIIYALAGYYADSNRYDSAITYTTLIIENNPEDINAYKYLAEAYRVTNNPEKAHALILKADSLTRYSPGNR